MFDRPADNTMCPEGFEHLRENRQYNKIHLPIPSALSDTIYTNFFRCLPLAFFYLLIQLLDTRYWILDNRKQTPLQLPNRGSSIKHRGSDRILDSVIYCPPGPLFTISVSEKRRNLVIYTNPSGKATRIRLFCKSISRTTDSRAGINTSCVSFLTT